MGQRRPHEPDAREQVRLDRRQDCVVIEIERTRGRWAAGVRHDDVETTEKVDCHRDEVLRRSRVGHVCPDGDDVRAVRPERRLGTGQRLLAPGGDDKAGSLTCKGVGNSATQTLGRRRDDCDPTLKTEIHDSSLSFSAGQAG